MTFYETLLLALATSVGTFLFGGLIIRARERARLDEEALAELRKVRIDAVVEVMRAVGHLYRATIVSLSEAEQFDHERTESAGQKAVEAAGRRLAATKEANDVAFANLILVPPLVRAAIGKHLAILCGAESAKEAQDAVESIAHCLEEYLPPMTRYQPLWGARRRR